MKKVKKKYAYGTGNPMSAIQSVLALTQTAGTSVADMINVIDTPPEDFRAVNRNSNPLFALGGVTKADVEVEGNEMLELPNGEVMGVKGASHEQGGVDLNLPVGTGVYSDRIDINGKSIATRKKNRTQGINRSNKGLANSPFDPIRKRSNRRMKENDEVSSAMEMELQENISKLMNQSDRKGYGGQVKYALGGVIDDITKADRDSISGFQTFYNQSNPDQTPLTVDGILGPKTQSAFSNFGDNFNKFQSNLTASPSKLSDLLQFTPVDDQEFSISNPNPVPQLAAPTVPSFTPEQVPTFQDGGDNEIQKLFQTQGDQVGAMGTAISGLAPLATTLANRIGDSPNINFSKNVGDDTIKTIRSGQGAISQIADNDRRRNDGRTQASLNSAAGSATSINTTRGLQQVINAQAAQQDADISSREASQTMQALNQLGNAEFRRDSVQAQGEQLRDQNDRRDRDNFYTQLSTSLGNLGTATQKQGRDMNRQQLNQDQLDLVNSMSKFGFKMIRDENGRFKLSN